MRWLPWRVVLRADRKAVLTMLGVALGAAFSLVSLAVPDHLATEGVSEEGDFGRPERIVSRADGLPFAPQEAGVAGTGVILTLARFDDGRHAWLAAIEGVDVPPGVARTVAPTDQNVTLVAPAPATLAVEERARVALAADAWLLLAPEELRALDPTLAPDRVSYLVTRDGGRLAPGFEATPAPAVGAFFAASTSEVGRDLVLVVVFSSILVALFVSEFLRSEVRARRPEIRIWRALGMRGGDVQALLVGRALAITLAGIALGALLALAALAVVLRSPSLPLVPLATVAAALLVASAVGAALPARAAARADTVVAA